MAAARRDPPETDTFTRLIEIMARLAVGDGVAIDHLVTEFATQLRAAVRRGLRILHVVPDAELVEELVMEAALVVAEVAPGWSPEGGARPWVWAERRINARISAYIGQHHDDLGDSAASVEAL